ncbi:MAG: ABC transporter ATP-binding protein [Chloroflexi bacterium]|nr:MAG: ABC transporter ATP-binding protein [Chloroflexota bacterium]
MSMLEIQSLEANYGSRKVLKGLSMTVEEGEVLALIGPNGSGKTTLIRSASGALPWVSGCVLANGQDISRLTEQQRARLISVVPQARDLPDAFPVRQTVLLGRTPYLGWLGVAEAGDRHKVEWALERTGTHALAERRIGELSGGEQQRVLLARALAQETPIMLLDEPTAHLDLHHQSGLLQLVKQLAVEGKKAVLMALHDLNLAALYADRVALLVEGELVSLGKPEDVLKKEILEPAFQVPIAVITHPVYGTPLILPDGRP